MARYDRIARLDAPDRENAFPGWLALRDLDGRERETELARRAHLRFLALRPVRRLLDRGFEETDAASFAEQVEGVRVALEQLPGRDAERRRIAKYLRAVDERTPSGLATATIAMGEAAAAAGHGYAAEEFYHTALEISVRSELTLQRMLALRCLGRLYAERGEFDRSEECLDGAATLAETEGDLVAWARALDGLATLRLLDNDVAGAHATLARIRDRGERERAERLVAMADAGACAAEVAAGSPEAAVEAGWRAIDALDPSDEDRNRVFLDLASAFRRLGLHQAAEACYLMVARSAASHGIRVEARIQYALAAAEAGESDTFRQRRRALLDSMPEGDHGLAAATHLGLARGGMIIEDTDDARIHLRVAIDLARAGGLGDAVVVAEDLLSGLEGRADTDLRDRPTEPSAGARTIADRIESMVGAPVASG